MDLEKIPRSHRWPDKSSPRSMADNIRVERDGIDGEDEASQSWGDIEDDDRFPNLLGLYQPWPEVVLYITFGRLVLDRLRSYSSSFQLSLSLFPHHQKLWCVHEVMII